MFLRVHLFLSLLFLWGKTQTLSELDMRSPGSGQLDCMWPVSTGQYLTLRLVPGGWLSWDVMPSLWQMPSALALTLLISCWELLSTSLWWSQIQLQEFGYISVLNKWTRHRSWWIEVLATTANGFWQNVRKAMCVCVWIPQWRCKICKFLAPHQT